MYGNKEIWKGCWEKQKLEIWGRKKKMRRNGREWKDKRFKLIVGGREQQLINPITLTHHNVSFCTFLLFFHLLLFYKYFLKNEKNLSACYQQPMPCAFVEMTQISIPNHPWQDTPKGIIVILWQTHLQNRPIMYCLVTRLSKWHEYPS